MKTADPLVSLLVMAVILLIATACRSTGQSSGTLKPCQVGPGPEDFEFDRNAEGGPRLIVSSAKRGLRKGQGQILSVPVLPEGLGCPVPFEIEPQQSRFHPVGISLVRQGGVAYLYVIVEGKPRSVRKFRIDGHRLVQEARLEDPSLRAPNDVVALPDGHLYVSNVTTRGFWGLLGHLFRKGSGNVVHYDGTSWTEEKVTSGIAFANGLAVSQNGETLYVAGFVDRAIHFYERNRETGKLTCRLKSIPLGCAAPDNLMWQDANAGSQVLTVATHLSSLRTLLNLLVLEKIRAPSAVYLIDTATEGSVPLAIFEDDGTRVSASSTAFLDRERLFISQLRRGQIWETMPQTITAPRCTPSTQAPHR